VMLAVIHRRAVLTVASWRFLSVLPQKLLTADIHTSWSTAARTVPELTSIRYPAVTRGDFGSVTADDTEFFKKFLNSPGQVLTEEDDLISYNIDWMGNYRGVCVFYFVINTTVLFTLV